MKILVLSESYPSQEGQAMAFVHTRNQYYVDQGYDVVVLCFDAKTIYNLDKVTVVTEADFKVNFRIQDFDVVVSHAPNLRNHIRFILKNNALIRNLVFFIHGHEVLRKSMYYPKPFRRSRHPLVRFREFLDDQYDIFKLIALSLIIRRSLKNKAHFVFVSQWMKTHFFKNLKMQDSEIRWVVIPNSVNSVFETRTFDSRAQKLADFVSIRHFDSPKYAVDLVVRAAEQNPKFQFHLYGTGRYFDYNPAPANLKVFKRVFKQSELPDILDQYNAALMPTRLDSQGVMVCEMATYGIQVFTSDIPVCREVLQGFPNVEFISNQNFILRADLWKEKTVIPQAFKPKTYLRENTIQCELNFFESLQTPSKT